MKKIINIILILGLFLPPKVFAADLSWEFAGWHGGGCFPNLAFDPHHKGRVYLASDVAGIYRSDDYGEKWYFVTKGLGNLMVAHVTVAPSDPNVLYAATKGGVFVSLDAAATWTAADQARGALVFERPANYRAIAVDPLDAKKLCAGTAKGAVFCSEDRGAHWKELEGLKNFLTQKKPVTAVTFDGQGKLYVSSAEGLFRCVLDGAVCERFSGPQAVTDFVLSSKTKGVIYAAGEEHLWMSADDGASWQKSQPVAKGKTYRIALDESGDNTIIRTAWKDGWKGGVVSSRDMGQSWGQGNGVMNGDAVANPTRAWADNNTRLTGLFIDPFDPQKMFRTDGWAVWRSDDGGQTWNEKIKGAPNVVVTDLAFLPDGALAAASMDNGLLLSSDRGDRYSLLFPLKYDDYQSGHVWRVVSSEGTLIATSSPWNKKINQVIVSDDGGRTFDVVRAGLPETRPKKNTMWGEGYPRALAVDPKDPDSIYLGIDGDDGGGLFVSRDRGKTWARSVGQPGSLRIYRGLKVDPTDPKRIVWGASGKNGGVYISEDGALSFVYSLKEMQWVFDLDIAPDGTIYAAGDSDGAKLYKSSSHGRGWKLIGDFGKGRALAAVTVDPKDPKRIAVSTASWGNAAPCRIFLSENAGRSFQDITGDLPDGAGASSMTFDPEGNYLYITRYAGTVYRLKI